MVWLLYILYWRDRNGALEKSQEWYTPDLVEIASKWDSEFERGKDNLNFFKLYISALYKYTQESSVHLKNHFQKKNYVLKENHMQRNFFPLGFSARKLCLQKKNLRTYFILMLPFKFWLSGNSDQNPCSVRTAIPACEVSIFTITSFYGSHF